MGNWDQLRDSLDGGLVTRDDEGYEDVRALFNSAIETRPLAIAQCASVEDVRRALRHARDAGLPLAVRSGGHSVAGASLVADGLVIDMRGLNSVTVDPAARTATVGGGATWSHFDRACQPHGLATTGGRISTTGVGGLTLGGGSGWFERKWGLACDNLLSVDLVTAAGECITASETENPDLFWALHGGGGNFGVATSFTFRLYPLAACSIALLLWPSEFGLAVSRRWRDIMLDAPEEIGGAAAYLTGPPEEFVGNLVGKRCAAAIVTCMGPVEELRAVIAPLLELAPPVEVVMDVPYADMQCMLDDPPGMRNYWSADYLTDLPDAALDVFCAGGEDMISPSASQLLMLPWGGAVARNAGTSAMANRDVAWVVHPFGIWEDPADDEQGRDWTHAVGAGLREWTTGATYLNFIGDEGADRIMAGFGPHYPRLAAVKALYDPDNVFNRWHNVQPEVSLQR
ncbi:putative oxidoreductase, oxygen dependent, FAD-dependent protein [Alloactinosynnema sp. L-07]|uniref:FAD-binding oxidoreductase n=1 Tax=Alloactinosynnema sp. L-07 TaxID=1653480 RepID=UPI00065F0080|nr:FAD-binding oxidoreductase [Alloactinosynnema sp. L-07]CRK55677.1 putative oxidoreductase, oxygen dependent, FAD-dependent protein [Alloactinosynnema sp. L-07]